MLFQPGRRVGKSYAVPESDIPWKQPTEVGGRFETLGLGLDHRFPTRTYLSISSEWLREKAERERGVFQYALPGPATPSYTLQNMDYDERSLTTTINQLLGREWSVGIRHRASQAELHTRLPWLSQATLNNANEPLETDGSALLHEVRLFVVWNHPAGFYSRFDAHWHAQGNDGSTWRAVDAGQRGGFRRAGSSQSRWGCRCGTARAPFRWSRWRG